MVNLGQGRWMCGVCSYESKFKTNLYNHVEVKHLKYQMLYTCEYCSRSYKSRNSYNVHMSMYHKQ